MQKLHCRVLDIQVISHSVFRVFLDPQSHFSFRAGQYLLVIMGDDDKRPFSIASTPEQNNIELHIGTSQINDYATAVIERMKRDGAIDIEIPYGDAWWRDESDKPLLLVAGGTGFSYVRSVLLTALAANPGRKIFVYWGGLTLSHLYDLPELQQIAREHPGVAAVPVVEQAHDGWKGHVGNVLQAIMADFSSLADYDIYIAGSFEMSKVARELFCQQRAADQNRLYSDAFSFID